VAAIFAVVSRARQSANENLPTANPEWSGVQVFVEKELLMFRTKMTLEKLYFNGPRVMQINVELRQL